MTPVDLLIFALGVGVGCCIAWPLGHMAGSRIKRMVHVTRTQDVFLPELEEPSCVMPPKPIETDWEDFDQRTGLREQIENARSAGGAGYRYGPRGFSY